MQSEIITEGEFEYIEKGSGEPIIVLHGLFGALSNFEGVFDHFSKNFRVIIPMLPIYTLPILNTNVKNIAKYLHEFIEFKGLNQVNLLGNSLGGHVGLVYAVTHKEKVKTLTLTGSSGLYENAMGDSFPKRGNKDFIKQKVEVTFYDPKHATPQLVDECFEIVNDKSKAIRIISIAKSAIRHNMAKEIPNLNIPVCLIWGKNDTITPPEVAYEFEELLPNSNLFWIDKCGHAPMMEHPEEFNKILSDWYAKNLA